jgi:hypothetical protein
VGSSSSIDGLNDAVSNRGAVFNWMEDEQRNEITDKLFVLSVMITLIASGALPLWGALLLSVRELGEAPLVVWWALSREKRRARVDAPRANIPGKKRQLINFPSVSGYAAFCGEVALDGYRGFDASTPANKDCATR